MHSRVPDNLMVTLLRQCYSAPSCRRFGGLGALGSKLRTRALHNHVAQLRQYQSTDRKSYQYRHSLWRAYATSSETVQSPKEIAVLGGGITGLASAFYLTHELPNAKITLYEASDTLGGWLRTKHVDVEGGTILFEQGPRTLRPSTAAGVVTLSLVRSNFSIYSILPNRLICISRYIHWAS